MSNLFAIDVGGQYLKLAESSISGIPHLRKNPQGKTSIPSAFAVKSSIPFDFPLNLTYIENATFKYGYDALKYLRKHPECGLTNPTFLVGRSQLYHPKYDPVTMTGLVLSELVSMTSDFDRKICFVVPGYWLSVQADLLLLALRVFRVPTQLLIDDTHAIACYFNAFHRVTENISVVFIDVGAFSTKFIGLFFRPKDNETHVNETMYEWSEKLGVYFFTLKIMEKMNISYKNAEKLLINGKHNEMFEEETELFTDLLKKVLNTCEEKVGPTKEIRLIGGGSSLKFLRDAIRNLTNATIVKDSPNEVLAVGGVLALMESENISMWPRTRVSLISKYTTSITCGVEQVVCEKNKKCLPSVSESFNESCDVNLSIDPSQIPLGVSTFNYTYSMTNVTNITLDESSNITFTIFLQKPIIEDIVVCNSTFCDLVDFQRDYFPDLPITSDEALYALMTKIEDERTRLKLLPQIEAMINELAFIITHPDQEPAKNYYPISDENKQRYYKIFRSFMNGDFNNMSKMKLLAIRGELGNIFKAFIYKDEKPAEPETNETEKSGVENQTSNDQENKTDQKVDDQPLKKEDKEL